MSRLPPFLVAFPLFFWGCNPDPTDDLGALDATVGPNDSGPTDSGVAHDAGVDPSLDGTSLAGITIEWPAPLELCTAWQEGRSLADELALKVHLILEPQVRPSLGRAHLEAATITQGQLRTGPLTTQRVSLTGANSSLASYTLEGPPGSSFLTAELHHTFPAGVLTERFLVLRVSPDARPVRIDDAWEHTFHFTPTGRSDGTRLEPCGGSANLRPAAFVLSAGTGAEAITLLRFAKTDGLRTAQMVPTGGLLQRADAAYELLPFTGYWSQTYAAGHHNWYEASVFDFTRELSLYETVFEPLEKGGIPLRSEVISRIGLVDINLPVDGNPALAVTTLDTTTAQESTRQLPAQRAWTQVDNLHLSGTITRCATGAVVTLVTGNNSVFQLLTCPLASNPGFELVGLVPLFFAANSALAGQRFEGNVITAVTVDGRSGYQVELGGQRLQITKNLTDDYFFLNLLDAGGNNLESNLASPIELDQAWAPDVVLELISSDGALKVSVVRRYVAQGAGSSSIYAPVSLVVERGGIRRVIDAWDALDYTSTHHNWDDVLMAKDEGVTYRWEVHFDNGPLSYSLQATRDLDGSVVLPETELLQKP
ncbi:MAG: hypothetical protein IPG45_29580 [Deltaproteobacteria bacterium]|nr:hypothetical protein [Deltaproteobacteria bacterium]